MDKRPAWDDYFMEIVEIVATRSTCSRRQVGALLVRDHRIITTGYNGAPQNMSHCADIGGCMREKLGIPSGERHDLCRALHAEQNAIIQAAITGVSVADTTLYCTCSPCILCAKMLINVGCKRVVFKGAYPDQLAMAFFKEAGVKVEQYQGPGLPLLDVLAQIDDHKSFTDKVLERYRGKEKGDVQPL